MNNKHRKTLEAIFSHPARSSIAWREVKALLAALGAVIEEAEGSRVAALLNGVAAVFHRPHPQKEMDRGAIVSLRRFLSEAGVKS